MEKEIRKLNKQKALARRLFLLVLIPGLIGWLIWFVRHPLDIPVLKDICDGICNAFSEFFWIDSLDDFDNKFKVAVVNFCTQIKDMPAYDLFLDLRVPVWIGLLGADIAWLFYLNHQISTLQPPVKENIPIEELNSGMESADAKTADERLAQFQALCADDRAVFTGDSGVRVQLIGVRGRSARVRRDYVARWDGDYIRVPLGDGTSAELELNPELERVWLWFMDEEGVESPRVELKRNVPKVALRGSEEIPRAVFTWLGGY